MRASCMNLLSGRTTGNLLYCTFAESKQCKKGLGLSCFLSVYDCTVRENRTHLQAFIIPGEFQYYGWNR